MLKKQYAKIGDFINWNNQSWFVYNLPLRKLNYGGVYEQEIAFVETINANNQIAHFNINPLKRIYIATAGPRNSDIPLEATLDATPFNLERFLTHENPIIREVVKLLEGK